MTRSHIEIIYTGGTFGSHGTPLSPLNSSDFLPILQDKLTQQYPNTHFRYSPLNETKDSSTLTPNDFYFFYDLIIKSYQSDCHQIILIVGTDTLAYLSAFLHYALRGIPIRVVITGSMKPLLFADNFDTNPDSDAWGNLTNGIDFFNACSHNGVFVSFAKHLFYGNSVQKIHSSDDNAFVGEQVNIQHIYPNTANANPILTLDSPVHCPIHSLFVLPNDPDTSAKQLDNLANLPPTAVLILGFGAGNLVDSPSIRNAINTLINKGFLVIMSSQCPFGERSNAYAVGAWQGELGVLSGGNLPIPALYGQTLWLCLSEPLANRKEKWTV